MSESLNSGWLRKLLRGEPHIYLGGREDPYLLRWFVIPRNHRLNIYVHKFLRSDDDRALHDHPWWFVSIMLRGRYLEHRPDGIRERRAPSIAFRRADLAHRVELFVGCRMLNGRIVLDPEPVWTVIITGPKRRHWGFHCPKRWVPWEDFTGGVNGELVGRGCGES